MTRIIHATELIILITVFIFSALGLQLIVFLFLRKLGETMRLISFSWWIGWLMGAAFTYALMRLTEAVK